MIINSYRFASAGATLPAPLHWFDLDSLTGGLTDQGSGTSTFNLGTTGTPTVASTSGANGQAVIDLDNGDYLSSTTSGWDSATDLLSVSVWFQADSINTGVNSLVSWQSNSNQLTQTAIFNNSAPFFNLRDSTSTRGQAYDGTNTVSTGTWYHMVGTYDGSDVKYYLDGVLQSGATETITLGAFGTANHPFNIGRKADTPTSATNQHIGKVGAVGIWDAGLTADQVSTLYGGGTTDGYYADYTFV
jgi:hypothetical protein